mmetsp:Transcript_17757/g.55985  ORF Transcript_17757/g.55985 Transcript_17757/m.55985 type:complete len:200 (-) Transcript_17757:458-1057(-)
MTSLSRALGKTPSMEAYWKSMFMFFQAPAVSRLHFASSWSLGFPSSSSFLPEPSGRLCITQFSVPAAGSADSKPEQSWPFRRRRLAWTAVSTASFSWPSSEDSTYKRYSPICGEPVLGSLVSLANWAHRAFSTLPPFCLKTSKRATPAKRSASGKCQTRRMARMEDPVSLQNASRTSPRVANSPCRCGRLRLKTPRSAK